MAAHKGDDRITREDLERELRSLVEEGQDSVADAGRKAAGAAGALAFLALALTYVLGRRRGSRARAQVEIRRI
jgi:uncharacterized protein (TIGR03382 family)